MIVGVLSYFQIGHLILLSFFLVCLLFYQWILDTLNKKVRETLRVYDILPARGYLLEIAV